MALNKTSASANSSTDFIGYMASISNLNSKETNFAVSDSDDDDIKIVKELKSVSSEEHRCDLCCEGEFLIDRLLRFGGLIDEKHKYVCDKCDKNFEHKSKMKNHYSQCKGPAHSNGIISLAQEVNNTIECLVCKKTFKSQGGLTKHMNCRHSGLTHTCDICKQVFDSFMLFRQHCFQHEKRKKKYQCTGCKKRFHYSGSLEKHLCNLVDDSNMVLNINKGK